MLKILLHIRVIFQLSIIVLILGNYSQLRSQILRAPALLEPKTRSFINTDTPTFKWWAPMADSLSFRLVIAEKSGKVVVDKWIEGEKQYTLADSLALKDLSIYYWNVSTFDGKEYFTSEDYSFWVDLNISLDLELRGIKLLSDQKEWQDGDVASFEVEILNAGELPCYNIEVILYNGSINQNYSSGRAYRKSEQVDWKNIDEIESGESIKIKMQGQLKTGYNHFHAEVKTTADYNDVLAFNNTISGPAIQTLKQRWRLNGLFVIYDKYAADVINKLNLADKGVIYNNVEKTREFFWTNTNIIEIQYDTLVMSRVLTEKDFKYIDEKWGYVLNPDDIESHLNGLRLPLYQYDFIYVFYAWKNTNRIWTGYRGYTYGVLGSSSDDYALAAQPVAPGVPGDEEVTIHELLRIIDGFYRESGDENFYAPDQKNQNTTFTKNIDYYRWILETWPSENWFSLENGEKITATHYLNGDLYNKQRGLHLFQNYPNPFNNYTTIRYLLEDDSSKTSYYSVKLSIYSILGEKVRTLLDGQQKPGMHSLLWDGRNDLGEFVTSGIYLYNLQIDNQNLIKKLIFIK